MHPIRRPPRRGFVINSPDMDAIAMRALFNNGALGGYWPADPAYAYEDSAGTIPASVNGVVGLRFDVSRGLQNIENITNSNNEAALFSPNTSNVLYNISRSQQSSIPGSGYYAEYVSTSNSHTYHQHSLFDAIANKTYKFSLKFYVPTGGISTFRIYDNSDGSWFGLLTNAVTGYPNAIQATTANKPYLRRTPVSNKYWLDSNTITGALTATFASSLGSACTIATVGEEGVTIAENKTITTTYNLTPPYGYNGGVLIINRALTASEKALVTRTLKRNAPYYPSIVDARLQMRGYAPNNENTVDTSIVTSFYFAWYGCSGLTSFPLINTAAGTIFSYTWYGCSGLTSFPLINTAAGVNFSYAWQGCSGLTSFPLINTAAGMSFNFAWHGCSGLTSFPLINTAAGTNFSLAWFGCSGLTSFPLINTAAGTNFSLAWFGCSGLTSFPANFFDSWTGVPIANCFSSTWESCVKLTLASVQNIVVSLVVSGKSAPATGKEITLWGAPALATIQANSAVMNAVTTLKSRGWIPTYKGTAL